MKKKIAVLGSTGSIGKTLLQILRKEKNKYEILLLTANSSYIELLKQAKIFNVKNLILINKKNFEILKKKTKNMNINVYNNYDCFDKILGKRTDYTMSSISGIDGLKPTLKIIKYSKRIAIANKESIVCGWSLINSELKKNKVDFVPVDSEHFSIWYGLQKLKTNNLEKIFLTASGGPFYKKKQKDLKKIKVSEALNHPNWKMGKKISTDSATLINKVYEVIEAKNIFGIDYKKIEILIHPKSYVHAILKFNNGLLKVIAHDTTMTIPIFNTLYSDYDKKLKSNDINLKILNDLNLKKADSKMFPMINLLNIIPNKSSLFETVIVSANDRLVELFLEKRIRFIDIQKKLFKLLFSKKFLKFRYKYPKKLEDITDLNHYVRLKIDQIAI